MSESNKLKEAFRNQAKKTTVIVWHLIDGDNISRMIMSPSMIESTAIDGFCRIVKIENDEPYLELV